MSTSHSQDPEFKTGFWRDIHSCQIFGIWMCLPFIGSTALEFQFGRVHIRWCYLKGGNWKSYWMLERWKLTWLKRDEQ